jgi:hypothetical protein
MHTAGLHGEWSRLRLGWSRSRGPPTCNALYMCRLGVLRMNMACNPFPPACNLQFASLVRNLLHGCWAGSRGAGLAHAPNYKTRQCWMLATLEQAASSTLPPTDSRAASAARHQAVHARG